MSRSERAGSKKPETYSSDVRHNSLPDPSTEIMAPCGGADGALSKTWGASRSIALFLLGAPRYTVLAVSHGTGELNEEEAS